MEINRIVVPVDGSDHGRRAATLAGMLASLYDAEVLLLHVLEPGRLSEEKSRMVEVEHGIGRGPDELPWAANVPAELAAMLQPAQGKQTQEQILQCVADKVVRTACDLVQQEGVDKQRIRVVLKDGRPAKAILEAISDQDADVVVMGSRGLSAASGTLLGSVSQRVASAADCTVITAR